MSAKNAKKLRKEKNKSGNSLYMDSKEFMDFIHVTMAEKFPNIPYEFLDKVTTDKGIESCVIYVGNSGVIVFSNVKSEPTMGILGTSNDENELAKLSEIPAGKKKHIFKTSDEETEYWELVNARCKTKFPNRNFKFGDAFIDDDGELTCRCVVTRQ